MDRQLSRNEVSKGLADAGKKLWKRVLGWIITLSPVGAALFAGLAYLDSHREATDSRHPPEYAISAQGDADVFDGESINVKLTGSKFPDGSPLDLSGYECKPNVRFANNVPVPQSLIDYDAGNKCAFKILNAPSVIRIDGGALSWPLRVTVSMVVEDQRRSNHRARSAEFVFHNFRRPTPVILAERTIAPSQSVSVVLVRPMAASGSAEPPVRFEECI